MTRDRRFAGFAVLTAAILLIGSSVSARISRNTIGDSATLVGGGHAAEGIVLLECPAGEQIRFTLSLTQNGVSATGHGAAVCTGALEAYEVIVPAGGEPASRPVRVSNAAHAGRPAIANVSVLPSGSLAVGTNA